MVKKLFSLIAVVLLTLSFAGSVLAGEIEGKVSKVERDGRAVTVKSSSGEEITLRISGSGTTIEGIGDRSEFKEGQTVKATYDEGDRNTASMVNVQK